jgi:hypothetical protein
MALGLQVGGGGDFDRVAHCKYDARAGRIFRIDRSQDSGGTWQTDQVEITNGFQAVMDLENIQVGWLNFPAGGAPSMVLVKLGEALPPKPADGSKQGFRVLMKLGKSSGGDLREMASNAGVSIAGMDALHTAYTTGLKDNAGLLPVVALSTTTAVTKAGKDAQGKAQSSTNYQPVWEIVKWVPRPAELGGVNSADTPAEGQKPDPKPEPVKVQAKALVNADDEF